MLDVSGHEEVHSKHFLAREASPLVLVTQEFRAKKLLFLPADLGVLLGEDPPWVRA